MLLNGQCFLKFFNFSQIFPLNKRNGCFKDSSIADIVTNLYYLQGNDESDGIWSDNGFNLIEELLEKLYDIYIFNGENNDINANKCVTVSIESKE